MTLGATIVLLILLFSLWFLYRRASQDSLEDSERSTHDGMKAESPLYTQRSRNRTAWLRRVPKIFTQPHLIPETVVENADYKYQTTYVDGDSEAASYTQRRNDDSGTTTAVRGSATSSSLPDSTPAHFTTEAYSNQLNSTVSGTASTAGTSNTSGAAVTSGTAGTSGASDASSTAGTSGAAFTSGASDTSGASIDNSNTAGSTSSANDQDNTNSGTSGYSLAGSVDYGQPDLRSAKVNTSASTATGSGLTPDSNTADSDYSVNTAANDSVSTSASSLQNSVTPDTSASAHTPASQNNTGATLVHGESSTPVDRVESNRVANVGDVSESTSDSQKISDSQLLQHHLEDSPNRSGSENNDELRQTQSELLSVRQQRDRYVEQIKSLQDELKSKRQNEEQSQFTAEEPRSAGHQYSKNDFLTYLDTHTDAAATSSGTTGNNSSEQVRQMFVRPAEQDDLKLIKGIGKVMEKTLHELGITTFKQLASFQQSDIQKVSDALTEFPGRIERDNWVGQAKELYQTTRGTLETER